MIEFNRIETALLEIVDEFTKQKLLTNKFKSDFNLLFSKNTLKIGVIGKMKAGKSSFVNALIFGGRVLPTGDTPVTVTLTEITYDENEGVDVELLTEEDINKLRELADSDTANEYVKESANVLLEQIDNIEGGYSQYAAKTLKISLSQLEEYVAANGKYSGLAKFVRIRINNKNLQGLSIIDTPGFNDPIKTRGESTKQSIRDCQIILFVHDYFDRYDNEEVGMATSQIEYAGISELIDVVNKTDCEEEATLSDWESLAEDYKNNRDEILSSSSTLLKDLTSHSPVICVSALMSLLGSMDINDFDSYDANKFNAFRERYEELDSKEKFNEYSNIPLVEKEINKLTRNSNKYLIETPLLKLNGELSAVLTDLDSQINEKQSQLDLLNTSRENYKNILASIDSLVDQVSDRFNNNDELSSIVQNTINQARNNIICQRSETIEANFTDEKFPEKTVLSSGVKRGNLSSYNIILLRMDGLIRVELDTLNKKLVSASNSYIEKLIADSLMDTKVNISEKYRNEIEKALKAVIEKAVARINVTVETERPTEYPNGKLTQKVLYLNKFQSQYNDERIQNDFIKKYDSESSQFIDDFDYKGAEVLGKLKDALVKGLNYSPEQKSTLIKELSQMIDNLSKQKEEVVIVCNALKRVVELYQGDSIEENFIDSSVLEELTIIKETLNKYENVENS